MNNEIKTEFKRHKIFDSWYYSLFVDDQKTNIYYPEIPSTFFLVSKEKAESEAELIRTGQVYPQDGNYEDFDLCGTFYANLQDAKKVSSEGHFLNKIYGLSGSDYTDPTKQDEEVQKIRQNVAYWSQWTKRIDKTTGKLLNNIGVYFYPYGYNVFFY